MIPRVALVLLIIFHAKADINSEWEAFKVKYGRQYNSSEDAERFEIFQEKVKMINAHNEKYANGRSSYEMEVNQFADQTREDLGLTAEAEHEDQNNLDDAANNTGYGTNNTDCEANNTDHGAHNTDYKANNTDYKANNTGYRANNTAYGANNTDYGAIYTATFSALTSDDIPSKVDWSKKGYVTSVKVQGDGATCYAFAAVGAVEALHKKETGKLVELSVAQVVDCGCGCKGSKAKNAFAYLKKYGSMSAKDYKYLASHYSEDGQMYPEKCKYRESKVKAKICSYRSVARKEETLMKALARVGPIYVSFQMGPKTLYYRKGIFNDCKEDDEDTEIDNHGMLLVGYGGGSGKEAPYWKIKNSWGREWGEWGYMRMERGKRGCRINYASYPVGCQDGSSSRAALPSGGGNHRISYLIVISFFLWSLLGPLFI